MSWPSEFAEVLKRSEQELTIASLGKELVQDLLELAIIRYLHTIWFRRVLVHLHLYFRLPDTVALWQFLLGKGETGSL